jgi:hypothetical protein
MLQENEAAESTEEVYFLWYFAFLELLVFLITLSHALEERDRKHRDIVMRRP